MARYRIALSDEEEKEGYMACTLYLLVNDDVATELLGTRAPITQAVKRWAKGQKTCHPQLRVKIDWTHLQAAKFRILTSARRASGGSPTEPLSRSSSPEHLRIRSHTAPSGELARPAELRNLFPECKEAPHPEWFIVTIKVVAGTDGEEATNICAALKDENLIFISTDFDMPTKTGGAFVNDLIRARGQIPCPIQFRTSNPWKDIKDSLTDPTASSAFERGEILFTAKGSTEMHNSIKGAILGALGGYNDRLTELIHTHKAAPTPPLPPLLNSIPSPTKTGAGFGSPAPPRKKIIAPRSNDTPITLKVPRIETLEGLPAPWATVSPSGTPKNSSPRVTPAAGETATAFRYASTMASQTLSTSPPQPNRRVQIQSQKTSRCARFCAWLSCKKKPQKFDNPTPQQRQTS